MRLLIAAFIAFLTPANAMLSVELNHLADTLDAAKQSKDVSDSARAWSSKIRKAIMDTTVCNILFIVACCVTDE